MSAQIVAAYLAQFRLAKFVDARQFIVTDDQFTGANVLFRERIARSENTFGRCNRERFRL